MLLEYHLKSVVILHTLIINLAIDLKIICLSDTKINGLTGITFYLKYYDYFKIINFSKFLNK